MENVPKTKNKGQSRISGHKLLRTVRRKTSKFLVFSLLLALCLPEAAAAGWRQDGNALYHETDGKADSGWYEDGEDRWYLLDRSGKALTGWQEDGASGGRFYLGTEGEDTGLLKTGWHREGGNTYFLITEHNGKFGMAATGWQWIGGYCYYFAPDGKMLKNVTTPDGYTVDENGAWTVNGVVQTR